MFAYVGSRTTKERNARGEGLSVFKYNPDLGKLDLIQVLKLTNPSYLAKNKSGDRLYIIHGDLEDISSFSIDLTTGKLQFLNKQSTEGKNPVHLALDPTESFIVVSNHISSSLVVLPLAEDGSLLPVSQKIELSGEPGPHRKEQPFSKPHFNGFDPKGQYVVVPDKGTDKIFVFEFKNGKLNSSSQSNTITREGSGPRHIAFHPNSKWAYSINELDSTITAYQFNEKDGQLAPFQITPSVSDKYTGNNRSSAIQIDAQGQFLYASNRGEDSIGVFKINSINGELTLIQTQSSLGKTPRFFTLDPSNQYILVANEDSDEIITLKVTPQNGTLTPTQEITSCGSPVCIIFSGS